MNKLLNKKGLAVALIIIIISTAFIILVSRPQQKNIIGANREFTAFVKNNDDKIEDNDELFIKYPNGKEVKLISARLDKDPEKNINGFHSIAFSPDKAKMYFLTNAWVTSGAIHSFDIETKQEKYICPGNTLYVIQDGNYKGMLIVNQNRYNKNNAGSYDKYYVVDKEGNEVEDLGDMPDKQRINAIIGKDLDEKQINSLLSANN